MCQVPIGYAKDVASCAKSYIGYANSVLLRGRSYIGYTKGVVSHSPGLVAVATYPGFAFGPHHLPQRGYVNRERRNPVAVVDRSRTRHPG